MNQVIKEHLISAVLTFITSFGVVIALAIETPTFKFSKESLVALAISAIIVGIRAVAKLVISWVTGYTPISNKA